MAPPTSVVMLWLDTIFSHFLLFPRNNQYLAQHLILEYGLMLGHHEKEKFWFFDKIKAPPNYWTQLSDFAKKYSSHLCKKVCTIQLVVLPIK